MAPASMPPKASRSANRCRAAKERRAATGDKTGDVDRVRPTHVKKQKAKPTK
jgi:hypothetical protein